MDVTIRPIEPGDVDALKAFFDSIPEADRRFFREAVGPGVIDTWLAQSPRRHHLAFDGSEISGFVAVLPDVGWSSHVGELRLVVGPAHRQQGVGRALARYGLIEGVQQGLSKLIVEVVAVQEATVNMFLALGFEAEALLRDHVRSADGSLQDLIVLSHFVEDTWAAMETMGIPTAVSDEG